MSVNVTNVNDDDAQIFYVSLTPPAGGKLKYSSLNSLKNRLTYDFVLFFSVLILGFLEGSASILLTIDDNFLT